MATGALPVERLREYLRELPPGARALLITELERAVLRGEDIPGGDMLLQEVRTVVRAAGDQVPRIGNPARLFFRPVEAFLTDARADRKLQYRIARGTLDPLWGWITRELMPTEAQAFGDEINRACVTDDTARQDALTADFQNQAVGRLHAAAAAARADDKMRRRITGQLGSADALDDVRDIATMLEFRDALALLESRLPGHIRNLADAQLESVKALLDSPLVGGGSLLPYALILVMRRLAAPWQLIRLAVREVASDESARIAATPYAAAVSIILADVERMVGELKADLKRGIGVTSLLKCIHDAARGLRTELDLSGDSPWARQLAAIRSDVASLLKTEIESVPGRVRRLLRPRPSSEIARDSMLDPGDVTDTEAMVELVSACRNYASELAINELTLRSSHELQQYLDTGTQALLDALRFAGGHDRPFRKSQVDAAVRFCAKVFGRDYASLLTKAAELASNAERKQTVKA
jgi:hypothetical protein